MQAFLIAWIIQIAWGCPESASWADLKLKLLQHERLTLERVGVEKSVDDLMIRRSSAPQPENTLFWIEDSSGGPWTYQLGSVLLESHPDIEKSLKPLRDPKIACEKRVLATLWSLGSVTVSERPDFVVQDGVFGWKGWIYAVLAVFIFCIFFGLRLLYRLVLSPVWVFQRGKLKQEPWWNRLFYSRKGPEIISGGAAKGNYE